MSCDFAHHDGAYILGSLSPADRSAFERHLAGCADCALGVRQLAGLPGLLARVSPDALETAGAPEPVPPTLLPALVSEARRSQRRRSAVLVGLAAAAALVVAGGSVVAMNVLDDDQAPTAQRRPADRHPGRGDDLRRVGVGDRDPGPDQRRVGHPPRPGVHLRPGPRVDVRRDLLDGRAHPRRTSRAGRDVEGACRARPCGCRARPRRPSPTSPQSRC